MKMPIEELMEKLGVDRVLTPYEAQPWVHYDDGKGITCSAEVRVGPRYDDIQTEIQLLFDEWDEEEDDEEEESGEGDGGPKLGPDGEPLPPKCKIIDGRQQIMLMCIRPTDNLWTTTDLLVKAQDFKNLIPKWDEKGCDFFRAAIEALQMGEIPDFDELLASQLSDDSGGGRGRRGRIGRKSPKANASALLGMKQGR
jgi:hypothetical protein